MTKRIFRSICLVALVVLVASLFLIIGLTYRYYSQLQQNQLRTEMALVSQAVEVGGLPYLQNLTGNECRITWISSDGDVLFERLRRITGYLVGSLERWNDGKKAEEAARVKHSVSDCDIACENHKNGVFSKKEKAERETKKKSAKAAIGKE